MMRRADGGVYALRDQFPRFAAAIADAATHVTLVSRTSDEAPEQASETPDLLPLSDKLDFVGTPFFKDAFEGYRRLPSLWRAAAPFYAEVLDRADVALLRVRHQSAPLIAHMARKRGVPLGLWWAAPVLANIWHNYRAASVKGQAARLVGRFEEAMLGRMAQRVAGHFILDEPMYEVAGRPQGAHWPIPNLVSRAYFVEAPSSRASAKFTYVFAGRLIAHKGIFDMLEAFGQLAANNPNLHLKVAGTGPDASRLAEAIAAHPQAHKIALLGQLSQASVRNLLRQGDAFLLPSYAEGLPKIMWEAWGAGCPIIISDVGGVARFAKNDENAWLIQAGDIRALTRSMAEAEADESKRLRLAKAGLATARNHAMEDELDRIRTALRGMCNASMTSRNTPEHNRKTYSQ